MANISDIKEAIKKANAVQTTELSIKFDEINKIIDAIKNRIDTVFREFDSPAKPMK